MKNHRILTCILLVICCILVLAGILYALDIIPRVEKINLEMQAWEVAEDGTVLGTHTLTVKGKLLYYRTKANRFDGSIQPSESYRYSLSGPEDGYVQLVAVFDRFGIFYSSAFGHDRSTNATDFLYFALDPDAGCMVLRPNASAKDPDAPRPYLMASVDPNQTPEGIMAHFAWFPEYS